MNEEINKKIDSLIVLLDNDARMIKLVEKKNKILKNKELLEKVNELKSLDSYSNNYKLLKQELFNDEDFVSFKELENEINYLILEINNKLRKLTNERRCNHESN